MSEEQDLNACNQYNHVNNNNPCGIAESNSHLNYAYPPYPQKLIIPAENQQIPQQFPPNYINKNEQTYYYKPNSLQVHQQYSQPFQMYPPPPPNVCMYPQHLQQAGQIQGEQMFYDHESPLLSANMLHAPHRETHEGQYEAYNNNAKMFIPPSVKNEHVEDHNTMVQPCTMNSLQEVEENCMQHTALYQNQEQIRKASIYSHPSNYASTCPSNNGSARHSIGGIQDTPFYQFPLGLTYSAPPTNCQVGAIPPYENQPQHQWIGSVPYRQKCECNSPYGCQIHSGNALSLQQQIIPLQQQQLPQYQDKGIKFEQEEIGKTNQLNQNKLTLSLGSYLVKQEALADGKRVSIDSGDSKGRTRLLSVPMTNSKVIEDEDSENEEQTSSSCENVNPVELNVKKEESCTPAGGIVLENKPSNSKLRGTCWSSNKTIKKAYKPKKKYKQSRQKNVFKNFGNALMNSIQNNFVIRDQIEKRLQSTALIDAFHQTFLKNQLNHLKNKEDFLQGWRTSDIPEDDQLALFKSVFKEVSLRFFQEYAEKYVNESDKLKNKDIHIKAIPIFIRGLQNVSELQKFKLS